MFLNLYHNQPKIKAISQYTFIVISLIYFVKE